MAWMGLVDGRASSFSIEAARYRDAEKFVSFGISPCAQMSERK